MLCTQHAAHVLYIGYTAYVQYMRKGTAAVLWANHLTHSTTAMSQILFNVIPFKLANDASVLTPQKCAGLDDVPVLRVWLLGHWL